jgi:hypothetical protein
MNEVLLLLLGAAAWIGFRAFFRWADVRDGLRTQVSAPLTRLAAPVETAPLVLPALSEDRLTSA